MQETNVYLTVTSTPNAELGALVPVDEFDRPADLTADGLRVDQIDISDIYVEDDGEWERLVTARIEEDYGLQVRRVDQRISGGFHPRFLVTNR